MRRAEVEAETVITGIAARTLRRLVDTQVPDLTFQLDHAITTFSRSCAQALGAQPGATLGSHEVYVV